MSIKEPPFLAPTKKAKIGISCFSFLYKRSLLLCEHLLAYFLEDSVHCLIHLIHQLLNHKAVKHTKCFLINMVTCMLCLLDIHQSQIRSLLKWQIKIQTSVLIHNVDSWVSFRCSILQCALAHVIPHWLFKGKKEKLWRAIQESAKSKSR